MHATTLEWCGQWWVGEMHVGEIVTPVEQMAVVPITG